MPDETLFTLRQLADELKLPESTVRYYRDAFLDHIPSVGTGRRRRYPAAAAAVLRSIAKSYATGRTRAEIIAGINHGSPVQAAHLTPDRPVRSIPLEEVSNVDLLAAILDGEREQRDALWQMAKEIVRLTEVLEGQDSVLNEIADRAGVIVDGRIGQTAPPVAAIAPSPAASAPPPAARTEAPIASAFFASPPAAAPPPYAAPPAAAAEIVAETLRPSRNHGDGADMEKLRAELESERALVERLRQSKLDLEHRTADAEAALEDRSTKRRPSVIRRLLGNERDR